MSNVALDRTSELSTRRVAGIAVLGAVAVFLLWGIVAPASTPGRILRVMFTKSALSATLRLSVPIAFAALGGIFAEKSGVINIGLEGLLIISAFTAVFATDTLAGEQAATTADIWGGLVVGVAVSVLLAAVFAVVCIEFRADQIIAGLAVWLIALGLAPFASQVIYGGPNTASVETFETITVPGLANIPFFGALFDTTPMVYLMFVATAVSWYTLTRTSFGRWVVASGENPKALDTAGVDVTRVRYTAVLISGLLAGIGGAALSLGLGQFVGNGQTMVNGKGFIAIVAYLFGNYNPVGALLSTFLFAGLDALQLRLQAAAIIAVPQSLVRTIPYVAVIVVLALFGKTRLPKAAGEHYESGDD
ncbi:simple sugar transport system permease protein [Halogranum amylolyticum]|uniref:Simple sugar transport system permease protein n=1 Tax=Halogranum amylolyticum TaxID=660520 RepID=A0A1H8SIB2_9EURY|nr:ABC transporter permease [Halogranum amylolyticum]SEO78391.1 simple sugar transport system permease protein [Halogranum amylolyticum]